MLLVAGPGPSAHAVGRLVAALVPLYGGRALPGRPGQATAEFVLPEGALAAGSALLTELEPELAGATRVVVCTRCGPDGSGGTRPDGLHRGVERAPGRVLVATEVDAPAEPAGPAREVRAPAEPAGPARELLATAAPGSLTLSPGIAALLAEQPGTRRRARELLAAADLEVAQVLEEVGDRRRLTIAGVELSGRRRRPSGEAAPLPRQLRLSGRLGVLGTLLVVGLWVMTFLLPDTIVFWERLDARLLDLTVALRSEASVRLALAVEALGSPWAWRPLRYVVVIALVVLRRWRHLLVALLAFFLLATIVDTMGAAIGRPRPLVPALTTWEGYAHPSGPVASLASTLVVVGLLLVPAGRWRRAWMLAATLLVTALGLARLHLGVDHPTDVVVAAVLGGALPLVLVRLLAPEKVFPVTWRRVGGAHLEIDGRRDAAIRQAIRDQLGFEVDRIEPVGRHASGGSTPLRLTLVGSSAGPDELFVKLYSTSHLRADRWYKVARTILYGSLEDELRHPSVRRLVEREDHLLLTLRQAGIACPRSYGVVEITPEREYLTVTEFLTDAEEISVAEVDDQVIDEGLAVIRRLWDAGLAHRDIKPGNVMVQGGHVRIVDVAFAMIRPSPWRQAVDLANMMLILALRTDPDRVYARALRLFAPEDIAEAFAATRSVTIPSESRSSLRLLSRTTGTDLVARFRALAPPRQPIAIQRWSRRRIALTLAVLAGIGLLLPLLVANLRGEGFL